ncbi:MAG: hypothetical protein ABUL62_06920 [Myxococcales bacterium]
MRGRRKSPIERLVLHAGAAAGLTLDQVNEMLASAKLPEVPATSWSIVQRVYAPWVRDEVEALKSLAFNPPTWSEVQQIRSVQEPERLDDEDADVLVNPFAPGNDAA